MLGVSINSTIGKSRSPLLLSNDWIIERDTKILWLPPDYQSPSCIAIWKKDIFKLLRIPQGLFRDCLKTIYLGMLLRGYLGTARVTWIAS